ncbi:MAG: SPOR domain-containing protein [Treponema sp.]|nr:SPOR domain-containing protein [Treponema sp.]
MNRLIFFLVLFTVFSGVCFSQTGVSLKTEIQNLEKIAGGQGTSPSERHNALVRLARLRQLSGDIEGAARNWLEAAAAVPGQVDDDALLACAYCLAAMGEWDRARTALEPLLLKSVRANFLNISINAINTGNTSTLAAIAENPVYSQMKSEIYFMLWKISGGEAAENWRQRLVNEFPQSPEGRLASGENSRVVKASPTPFWLFMGGLDSLSVLESEPLSLSSAVQPAANQSANAVQTVSSQSRLQTGLFSRQENAQAQAASLRQAGFSSSIERRIVNNNEMWAVVVSAGQDTNRTIAALRNAGFESFPL